MIDSKEFVIAVSFGKHQEENTLVLDCDENGIFKLSEEGVTFDNAGAALLAALNVYDVIAGDGTAPLSSLPPEWRPLKNMYLEEWRKHSNATFIFEVQVVMVQTTSLVVLNSDTIKDYQ